MYDNYHGKLTFAFYALASLLSGILHFVLHKFISCVVRKEKEGYIAIP